jgi:integrase/recombinase XerD
MSFPTLSTAVQGYLIHKSARGLSGNTMRNYKKELERFVEWLEDPLVNTVTSQQIERYFKYLNEDFQITHHGPYKIETPRKLSGKSLQNAWGTLSNFWKWVEAEFEIKNPFGIQRIKANSKPVDPIPQEEVEKLLKACDSAVRVNGQTEYTSRRSTAKRDKALILSLLDMGLRVTELCELTVGNVDFQTNRVLVIGKGDKQRYVYFGKICRQALWRYFIQRFPDSKAKPAEPFFVCEDGIHPLTRNNVALLIGRLGNKVGDPNLHPHRFRHTFAIQFLRNEGNIFELQALLGHSSLEMVQHYARLAEMDLENAAMRSSPADHWRL